jgi:hypothetical protein
MACLIDRKRAVSPISSAQVSAVKKHQDQPSADCQVPQVTGWAMEATPEAPARVVSGLAENTDSID